MIDKLYDGLITKEQRDNLITLRNGLIDLFPTHDKLFNMGCFVKPKNDKQQYNEAYEEAEKATPENPCTTSCCIIGYGPSCGVPRIKTDWDGPMSPWDQYSFRVFVDRSEHNSEKFHLWEFLFHPAWDRSSNTYAQKHTFDSSDMQEAIARLTLVITGQYPGVGHWRYADTYFKAFSDVPLVELKNYL